MAESKSTVESIRGWVVEHKLRAVGCLWLSGITGSLAYNWSQPGMKTSVKIIHARLHAQALTLAALAGAALVEYYDHKSGTKADKWKEVKHDNTVTWLAFWNDPINPKEFKYVFLAASSSLKGQSDKMKYEKARTLKSYIKNIRASYTKDFKSKDIPKQQIAVATYLIDKLALRAGNEKDDDEADTVGCCTLKVGNVECIPPSKLKLSRETKDGDVADKIVVYQHANKEVAIICNHQRSVSKSHGGQMTKLTEKIQEIKDLVKELKTDLDRAKNG